MTPERVKQIRKALNMTQSQLAAALRLSGSDRTRTVRSWESGDRVPSGPVTVALELMLEKLDGVHYKDAG